MKKAYIGIIVLAAAIFLLTGCGSIQDKVAEKTTEAIAEKAVGGNVDITKDGVKVEKDGVNFETGTDLKWPKDAMGDLPELNAKIDSILNDQNGKGGTVVYSGISLEDAKAYVEKLKELGYKDGLSISDADLLSYSGQSNSGASVAFMYSISPKEGSIMYKSADAE